MQLINDIRIPSGEQKNGFVSWRWPVYLLAVAGLCILVWLFLCAPFVIAYYLAGSPESEDPIVMVMATGAFAVCAFFGTVIFRLKGSPRYNQLFSIITANSDLHQLDDPHIPQSILFTIAHVRGDTYD